MGWGGGMWFWIGEFLLLSSDYKTSFAFLEDLIKDWRRWALEGNRWLAQWMDIRQWPEKLRLDLFLQKISRFSRHPPSITRGRFEGRYFSPFKAPRNALKPCGGREETGEWSLWALFLILHLGITPWLVNFDSLRQHLGQSLGFSRAMPNKHG